MTISIYCDNVISTKQKAVAPTKSKPPPIKKKGKPIISQSAKRYKTMKRTKSMIYNPTEESRELFLVATNDGDLYRRMITPIINNLRKKAIKGTYDNETLYLCAHSLYHPKILYIKQF